MTTAMPAHRMSSPAPLPQSGASPTSKARPGQLRAMVARELAAAPSTPFTVSALARTLGHSGGAVGNACETLVSRGEANRVGYSPRRYQATPTTESAARQAIVTPRQPTPTGTTNATSPPSGTTVASPAPKPGRPAPVKRPNGQEYRPRGLAQMADVEALQKLRTAQVTVLLYGPPGTGKTSLIEAAFPDLITVAGDGDTEVADFIGEYTQDENGGYVFVYGPLIEAMQQGRALLIDDATLISPKVLAALYPAMDGRRQIQVKAHKGETITAADGFYVIAGHNPGVHGAVLTEALASRFSVQVQVSSDYTLAKNLGINTTAVEVARALARQQQAGEVGWAPQLRELLAFQKIADVLGDQAAFANLVGIAPLEDQDMVAETVAKRTGQKTINPLSLGPQL